MDAARIQDAVATEVARQTAPRGEPLAKRLDGQSNTDCALKGVVGSNVSHLDLGDRKTYGLQFKALERISDQCERVVAAGNEVDKYKVCMGCLNESKETMMRHSKGMPCVCCYRTCQGKRDKSVFCKQCHNALGEHEADNDDKKAFFFSQLMMPVKLKYPGWAFAFNHEWRTIGLYTNRTREKRCDAVIIAKNVLGSQHVFLGVEFVSTAEITDESLSDKRKAMCNYAKENRGTKFVFVIAKQTVKGCDMALAEMVVLRQWLTAALLASPQLPDGEKMTLLTLGNSVLQRARPVIEGGRHVNAFDRPQHDTHAWKYAVHWNEDAALDRVFGRRPSGDPIPRLEATAAIFGRAGLVELSPAPATTAGTAAAPALE